MHLGIENLFTSQQHLAALKNKRVAVLANAASVTSSLQHSVEALFQSGELNITALFGPQQGFHSDKQDNMIETPNQIHGKYQVPVYSLYGEVRRPTAEMMAQFDVLLIDLQDIGTRIYTFATTLLYILEEASKHAKEVWVLDRPNPAGRPIDGGILQAGFESFVGAGPMPMRHGLTLGELGLWYRDCFQLDVDYRVIPMDGYTPDQEPDYGWPRKLAWVNPSPNVATPYMPLAYPGTVLLEGTTLSEARGTTRPLEMVGAPDIDQSAIMATMKSLGPQWLQGCTLRPCYFEPTFHKHQGQCCQGFQIHCESSFYDPQKFKPYRLIALWFKAIRLSQPDYPIWRDFAYEYTSGKLPIDFIDGSARLREWVDDPQASVEDFDAILQHEEKQWQEQRAPHLLY